MAPKISKKKPKPSNLEKNIAEKQIKQDFLEFENDLTETDKDLNLPQKKPNLQLKDLSSRQIIPVKQEEPQKKEEDYFDIVNEKYSSKEPSQENEDVFKTETVEAEDKNDFLVFKDDSPSEGDTPNKAINKNNKNQILNDEKSDEGI